MSLAMKEIIALMQLTIVPSQEYAALEANKEAAVKQDKPLLDGLIFNVENKTKTKNGNDANVLITIEDVVSSLKEFMKETQGKYAVLGRPPTNVSESQASSPSKQSASPKKASEAEK